MAMFLAKKKGAVRLTEYLQYSAGWPLRRVCLGLRQARTVFFLRTSLPLRKPAAGVDFASSTPVSKKASSTTVGAIWGGKDPVR